MQRSGPATWPSAQSSASPYSSPSASLPQSPRSPLTNINSTCSEDLSAETCVDIKSENTSPSSPSPSGSPPIAPPSPLSLPTYPNLTCSESLSPEHSDHLHPAQTVTHTGTAASIAHSTEAPRLEEDNTPSAPHEYRRSYLYRGRAIDIPLRDLNYPGQYWTLSLADQLSRTERKISYPLSASARRRIWADLVAGQNWIDPQVLLALHASAIEANTARAQAAASVAHTNPSQAAPAVEAAVAITTPSTATSVSATVVAHTNPSSAVAVSAAAVAHTNPITDTSVSASAVAHTIPNTAASASATAVAHTNTGSSSPKSSVLIYSCLEGDYRRHDHLNPEYCLSVGFPNGNILPSRWGIMTGPDGPFMQPRQDLGIALWPTPPVSGAEPTPRIPHHLIFDCLKSPINPESRYGRYANERLINPSPRNLHSPGPVAYTREGLEQQGIQLSMPTAGGQTRFPAPPGPGM